MTVSRPEMAGFWQSGAASLTHNGVTDEAEKFLVDCGLKPNADAVDQLVRVFLPALRIMCEREHDPKGQTWKESGWKPLLHEIMKKSGRLRYRSWRHSNKDYDSPIDMINYLGFLKRAWDDDLPMWGEWGQPGE